MIHSNRALFVASMLALMASNDSDAQRRTAPSSGTVQVDVALQAGGAAYASSGPGECKASRQASIHGVPAALYSASHASGRDGVRLTLWQPKGGGAEMVALNVTIAGKHYDVDTVTSTPPRPAKGSASVKLESSGAGGSFSIDAAASDGTKIKGALKCSRFEAIVAEGG